MQNSPEFNTFFVSVVKKHEVLYNHTLVGHSDKDRIRDAWQKVAAEVQGTEHECKDRWRCLRVCFLRMLRYSQPNYHGPRNRHRKAYYLAEAMDFLLPFVKPKHAPLGYERQDPFQHPIKTEPGYGVEEGLDSGEQSEDQSELYPTDLLELEDADHSNPSSIASSRVPELYTEPNPCSTQTLARDVPQPAEQGRRRRKKVTPTRQEYYAGKTEMNSCDLLETYTTPSREVLQPAELEDGRKRLKVKRWSEGVAEEAWEQEDGDWLFLKSLLPDMRRLTEKQKRRFKQKVLGLFDDVED